MEEQLRFMETKSEELVRDERRKLQDSVVNSFTQNVHLKL